MYGLVNDALNSAFLGGRFESRPLYLVMDKRARDEVADRLGMAPADVDSSCCRQVGEQLAGHGDPYGDIVGRAFSWRAGGRKTKPPFTAVLYVLSRAAELMVSDANFSSSNYYRRLAEITGADWSRLSLHGKSTEMLWRSFNNWLADTDFQFGRPTARAVNSLRYVGLAMSQAIVREEDRHRFHDMFEKYGFRGTDTVTEQEINQYIGTWIHGTRSTGQLKAAWQKAELRPRICEAAMAELQEWSGELADRRAAAGNAMTRLSLAASFRRDLLKRTIALNIGREAEVPTVDIPARDDQPARTLGNNTFGSFATVEPRASIPWPEVLVHGFQLSDSRGAQYDWSGRAVIPLSRSERGDYWTEVGRVTIGASHLVLAREEKRVRESVEAALEQVAKAGYTLSTARELGGLPLGWVAYENVEIVRPLGHPGNFQEPLSAVGDVGGLRLLGGLKIGQAIWHQRRPPRVALTGSGGPVSLVIYEGTSNEGETVCEERSETSDVVLDLSHCAPGGGNLHVVGQVQGKDAGTATLLLRSAERPRPIDRQLRGVLAYDSAWHAGPAAVGLGVRGLSTPEVDMEPPRASLASFSGLGQLEGQAEEAGTALGATLPAKAVPLDGLTLAEVMKLPCDVRGLHVFRYETVPPDFPKYAPVNKECKDCALHVLERRGASKASARTKPTRTVPFTGRVHAKGTPGDVDLWFDAACFLGNGSTSTFEAIVAADEVDPWRAAHVLRDLSWLGLLDIGYGGGLRPSSWSVSPPVLAFHDERKAFLAGFRDSALVAHLADSVSAVGGVVSRIESSGRPGLVELVGINVEAAREALTTVKDAHGRSLEIVVDPALRLARFCATGAGLDSVFKPMTLASGGEMESFDLSRNRWRRVNSSEEVGAYRFSYAGTQYAYRAPSRQAYSTSHELAKLAAARASGTRLHAYDEDKREFTSVLGCEPPALLGRALVACSGRLPTIAAGISTFAGVSPAVAGLVLQFLYNGALPS